MATQLANNDVVSLPAELDPTDVVTTPFPNGGGLPLFIQPRNDLLSSSLDAAIEWVGANRPAIDALMHAYGAVVLRGFPFWTTAAFQRVLDHYDYADFDYSGGASPRGQIDGKVFEATHAPAEALLGMHQEMAYMPHFPGHLGFYCRIPPASGGETHIADMRLFTAALNPAFRAELEKRGVRYTRNFRDPNRSVGDAGQDIFHKTWTDTFGTTDPDEAVEKARAMQLVPEWQTNGSLSCSYTARGLIEHPVTGETLSFNQIPTQSLTRQNLGPRFAMYDRIYGDHTPRPYNTSFGDGTPIPEEFLDSLYTIMQPLIVAFPWSAGDVMLIDNYRVAHGRNSYTGRRDVQVALLK